MKELSIEEKAKRYDEAIELAKDSYNYPFYPGFIRADIVFPELNESKDERIRKDLIEWFEEFPDEIWRGHYKNDILDWFEKQGEQKPAEWSQEDTRLLDNCIGLIEGIDCTEEEQNWLKSLKGRVQPKVEWSEEDENNILFLTSIIEECFKNKEKITLCGDTVCANFTKENVIDRLKSLRLKSHWKPSEEQIRVLDLAIRCGINKGTTEEITLVSLFNELKKLK